MILRPAIRNWLRTKGIAVPYIKRDSKGLFNGLEVEKGILGNPIKGLPDLGAIEMNKSKRSLKDSPPVSWPLFGFWISTGLKLFNPTLFLSL